MRVLDLFSGIGGFALASDRVGFQTVAFCEIEPFPRRVLAKHWPAVRCYDDVRTVDPSGLGRIDLITGGFPCQDLSVAGKRAGLAGDRSGLFWEIVRLAEVLRPSWLVLENVPGLLSSNDGRDMQTVMDALENLKYICDVDILDAQFFGVAQRRRRVFIVCQHVDHLIQQKTISSALTISQCLIEILHASLIELKHQSLIGSKTSDFPSGLSVDGLTRRMRLFDLESAESCEKWRQNLDAVIAKYPRDHALLDLAPGGSEAGTRQPEGTKSENTSERTDTLPASWNTAPSWQSILDVTCKTAKWCITSTSTSSTTHSTIFSSARALVNICASIVLWKSLSPSYWSAASSALTALEECTNCARSASNDLFTPVEWVQPWRNLLGQALRVRAALRSAARERYPEVQFEPKGSLRHPAPRRTKGEDPSGTLGGGTGSRGWCDDLDRAGAFIPLGGTVSAKWAKGTGGPAGDECQNLVPELAYSLTARNAQDRPESGAATRVAAPIEASAGHHGHSSPRGDGADNQVVGTIQGSGAGTARAAGMASEPDFLIPIQYADQWSRHQRQNGMGLGNEGDPCYTLEATRTHGDAMCPTVGFNWQSGGDVRHQVTSDGMPEVQASQVPAVAFTQEETPKFGSISPALDAMNGRRPSGDAGASVRRLTPTECERLQGFSWRTPEGWQDGHTCLCGKNRGRSAGDDPCTCPDGARYRALGNAVAVPVVEWILRKIAEAEALQ